MCSCANNCWLSLTFNPRSPLSPFDPVIQYKIIWLEYFSLTLLFEHEIMSLIFDIRLFFKWYWIPGKTLIERWAVEVSFNSIALILPLIHLTRKFWHLREFSYLKFNFFELLSNTTFHHSVQIYVVDGVNTMIHTKRWWWCWWRHRLVEIIILLIASLWIRWFIGCWVDGLMAGEEKKEKYIRINFNNILFPISQQPERREILRQFTERWQWLHYPFTSRPPRMSIYFPRRWKGARTRNLITSIR